MFFLREINEIIKIEQQLVKAGSRIEKDLFIFAKKIGFSNDHISNLTKININEIIFINVSILVFLVFIFTKQF